MSAWSELVVGRVRDVEAARAAAYVLSGRAWVLLDADARGLVARVLPKREGDAAAALEAEFREELANQRLRLKLARAGRAAERRLVREAVSPRSRP